MRKLYEFHEINELRRIYFYVTYHNFTGAAYAVLTAPPGEQLWQSSQRPTLTKLSRRESGYDLHWCEQDRGFGLRVTKDGKRTYIAQGRVNSKEARISIGSYGVFIRCRLCGCTSAANGTGGAGMDANT